MALFLLVASHAWAAGFSDKARWITASHPNINNPNTWIAFRKDVHVDKVKGEVLASIAADSKYWLWVNGELAVFEGGLKRGPNPTDSYYDTVDLAPYLHKGDNSIAVLVCYFGKTGFSHISSGKSGLLFDSPSIGLHSDASWMSAKYLAYGTAPIPEPNYRLSESNIRFDGKLEMVGWQTRQIAKLANMHPSVELGQAGSKPWNKLHPRPTPLWKDYGLTPVNYVVRQGADGDTLVARLPYNMQYTPYISLNDPKGGTLIRLQSDHIKIGTEWCVVAEYVTRQGEQQYESLGWISGDELHVIVPHGFDVSSVSLQVRETGFNTVPEGTFTCDDEFFCRFWRKGLRTLYVNMRDTFFDCPDRERAQWWGDICIMMGECFYTYDTQVHSLMRKGIYELCNFQNKDGILHSPIPGNYDSELPAQMLSSVGRYGIWHYFMNTGDTATIRMAYPYIKKYLANWKIEEPSGLTAERHGAWDWGDWGDHRDIRLLYAGWHYIALDAASNMALLLGYPAEAEAYRKTMARVKEGFEACWNGRSYRHPSHKGEDDDRVQALAVVAGIAGKDKYDSIYRFLQSTRHASPYMEKYVMESLFIMGYPEYAMQRCRERYGDMVRDSRFSTLYEGWALGQDVFGEGTVNHAWSGGPLTVIAQYLMGVAVREPGWSSFTVCPQPTDFGTASISIPTVRGMVCSSFKRSGESIQYELTVPSGTRAYFYLPADEALTLGGKFGKYVCDDPSVQREGRKCLLLPQGKYKFRCSKR